MPLRALSLAETAAEINRSAPWLGQHWRRLVAEHGFPPPILDEPGALCWSQPALYAWLDRDLPPERRAIAAAYRAALEAALARKEKPAAVDEIADAQRRLTARFGRPA